MPVPDPWKERMTNSSWENKINEYLHGKEARPDSKAMYHQVPEYTTSCPIRPCRVYPVGIISPNQSKCPDAHKRKNQNDEEQRARQGQGTKTKEHRHPYHYILPDHHWLLHTPFTEGVVKGAATNLWLMLYPT